LVRAHRGAEAGEVLRGVDRACQPAGKPRTAAPPSDAPGSEREFVAEPRAHPRRELTVEFRALPPDTQRQTQPPPPTAACTECDPVGGSRCGRPYGRVGNRHRSPMLCRAASTRRVKSSGAYTDVVKISRGGTGLNAFSTRRGGCLAGS